MKILMELCKDLNEKRPYQALWNFTSVYAHRIGNKSRFMTQYNQMVKIAKERRMKMNSINGERAAKLTPFYA